MGSEKTQGRYPTAASGTMGFAALRKKLIEVLKPDQLMAQGSTAVRCQRPKVHLRNIVAKAEN